MSTLTTRVKKLERSCPPPGQGPPVEIWIPDNRRGGPPPGRYPCPHGGATLVIYDPSEVPGEGQNS